MRNAGTWPIQTKQSIRESIRWSCETGSPIGSRSCKATFRVSFSKPCWRECGQDNSDATGMSVLEYHDWRMATLGRGVCIFALVVKSDVWRRFFALLLLPVFLLSGLEIQRYLAGREWTAFLFGGKYRHPPS